MVGKNKQGAGLASARRLHPDNDSTRRWAGASPAPYVGRSLIAAQPAAAGVLLPPAAQRRFTPIIMRSAV